MFGSCFVEKTSCRFVHSWFTVNLNQLTGPTLVYCLPAKPWKVNVGVFSIQDVSTVIGVFNSTTTGSKQDMAGQTLAITGESVGPRCSRLTLLGLRGGLGTGFTGTTVGGSTGAGRGRSIVDGGVGATGGRL